uniref:Uncharacterized protein n=1 Tax=Arundo donax TaxID=35708 RepID=A0A0A9GTL4_ARUDO
MLYDFWFINTCTCKLQFWIRKYNVNISFRDIYSWLIRFGEQDGVQFFLHL